MSADRILIVDDEPQILRALRNALTGHGYEVDTAADGESALVKLAARLPDALILDLMMPGVDGFDVLHEIRAWSDIPIIVLSARGQERDKVRTLDMGADDYLTKPFGVDELLARIRAVLRRRVTVQSPTLQFGDIVIDFARRIVTKNDVEVHLTPTEFELLRVLATNAGKVLTHRQLLEQTWGAYAADNSQQLRVYINYLRRKLEENPARPRWIVTDPGVGYRLRAIE